MKLTIHLHLVQILGMCGALPPFLQYAFMAWCLIKQEIVFMVWCFCSTQGQLYLFPFLMILLLFSERGKRK